MESRLPSALGISFCLFPIAGCEIGVRQPPLEAQRIVVDPAGGQETVRPRGIAFADLDGKGLPDIVVSEPGGPILAHRFPGWERNVISPDGGGDALAVADIDGDGRLDVVSAGSSLAWYRNPGRLGIAFKEHALRASRPGPPYPASAEQARPGASNLSAADIDDDGRCDILMRGAADTALILLLQTEAGNWSEVSLPAPDRGSGLALADLDGDGRLDIVGGGWYLSQGANPAHAVNWVLREVAAWPHAAAVAALDVDQDGRIDLALAASDREHPVAWFRNPGPGSRLPWTGKVLTRSLGHVRRLEAADLDGDGHADLAFAEEGRRPRSRVGVLVSPGGAGQWRLRLLDDQGSMDLSIADVGRDGRLEVLAASPTGDARIRLLTNLLPEARKTALLDAAVANHPLGD